MYNAKKAYEWALKFYGESPSPQRFWFMLRMNELMMERVLKYWPLMKGSGQYIAGGKGWESDAVEYLDNVRKWKRAAENIILKKDTESSVSYSNALNEYFLGNGSWEWVPLVNSFYNGVKGTGVSGTFSEESKLMIMDWFQDGPISRIIYDLGREISDKNFELGKQLSEVDPNLDYLLRVASYMVYGIFGLAALGIGIYAYSRGKK